MVEFLISEIESKEKILTFWNDSPSRTIFTHPEVLPLMVENIRWMEVKKGEEIICIWPICFSSFRGIGFSRFSYYVGPLWSRLRNEQSIHRWFDNENKIYQLFFKEFCCSGFPAEISVTNLDIRPFLWFNIESNTTKFQIQPRYTAVLKNLQSFSCDEILSQFNSNRRREIKKINNNISLFVSDIFEIDELVCLYKMQFESMGYLFSEMDKYKIENLFKLVQMGFGFMSAYRLKSNNKIVSANLILECSMTSNLVINVVDENYKHSGVGTATIFNAIIKSKLNGRNNFDFNGANSQLLSLYKHSFGAVSELYFDIKTLNNESAIF